MERDYSKEYAAAAKEFATRITTRLKDEVRAIILFGSVARGQADPDSDIDVLVVLKNSSRSLRNKVYDTALDVQLDLRAPLAVKIYDQKTFDVLVGMKTPFMSFIQAEGKIL